MKIPFDIEKLTDWHYNPKESSKDDLKAVGNALDNIVISKVDAQVAKLIKNPYKMGGIKRIHIGDPALDVNNPTIGSRAKKMREVGYTDDAHFIEFNNDVLDEFAKELKDRFNLAYEHHCTIIVPPGQCMPAHGDTYSYLMKMMSKEHPKVKYDLKANSRRYMVMLTDWSWGQSFGAGNSISWQWSTGRIYTWGHKYLHWCSNAGFTPIVFFEITGLELKK